VAGGQNGVKSKHLTFDHQLGVGSVDRELNRVANPLEHFRWDIAQFAFQASYRQ